MQLKYIFSVLVLIFLCVANGDAANNQQQVSDELTFKMSTAKTKFVHLEPITITLRLSNDTDKPMRDNIGLSFIHAPMVIYVTHNGERKPIQDLSRMRVTKGGIEKNINPGDKYEMTDILMLDLEKTFPEPGTYQLQTELYSRIKKKAVMSNIVTIDITKPVYQDLEAYNYIKQNTKPDQFFDLWSGERNRDILVNFVARFRDTVYGDHLALRLAIMRLYEKQYKEASIELEKLINKSNSPIAELSLYSLVRANVDLGNEKQAVHYLDLLKQRNPKSRYIKGSLRSLKALGIEGIEDTEE